MGRRKKAAKKIVQKKKYVVATVFKCIFCNHDGSVQCKLNYNTLVGELSCRVCDAHFEMRIHTLSDPIDIFSEWLDKTQEKQDQTAKSGGFRNVSMVARPLPTSSLGVRKRDDDDEEAEEEFDAGTTTSGDKGHHEFVPEGGNEGGDDDDDDDDDDDSRRKKPKRSEPPKSVDDGDNDVAEGYHTQGVDTEVVGDGDGDAEGDGDQNVADADADDAAAAGGGGGDKGEGGGEGEDLWNAE